MAGGDHSLPYLQEAKYQGEDIRLGRMKHETHALENFNDFLACMVKEQNSSDLVQQSAPANATQVILRIPETCFFYVIQPENDKRICCVGRCVPRNR